MQQFYDFFAEHFGSLFNFFGKAIPALVDAAELIRFIILIAGLVLAAVAVVVLVIGCFKVRFFRRLARVLLIIEGLGAVGIGLIAANSVETGNAVERVVKALEIGSPEVFNLIHGIFSDFGTAAVPSFIIIVVAFVVICVLLHLLILLSKIIIRKSEAKEDKGADVPEALPTETEEQPASAPAPAAEPAPVVATAVPAEEPIAPADVPEAELETVIESDAAPAVAEEPAEEAPAEESAEEEAAAEENAPVPDYPKLENPVFMPIPSAIFDTVDFADPKRDGFEAKLGVYAPAAEKLISDEAAEDMTFVVYRRIEGKIAELPIDALNANFKPYSYVDAKILRQKGLIPESAGEVKITAFGKLDKPLMVQASSFGPGVAKMIILAGGRPILVQ